MSIAVLMTENGITVVYDNKDHSVDKSHPRYKDIVAAYREKRFDDMKALIDNGTTVQTFGEGKLTVEKGVVKYGERVLGRALTKRILAMIEEGFDVDPMVKFLDNLDQNPSARAVNELYAFLEGCNLPITDDGYFLAYKRVNWDFKDFHTGKIDNSVGQKPAMKRNEVDDDKQNTCSFGLHFCSLPYLKEFHKGQGHIVIVKINPKDVVSIPVDYNFTKGRTCEYEVIGIHTSEDEEAFKKSVEIQNEKKKTPEQKQAELIADAVKTALTDLGLAGDAKALDVATTVATSVSPTPEQK